MKIRINITSEKDIESKMLPSILGQIQTHLVCNMPEEGSTFWYPQGNFPANGSIKVEVTITERTK